MILVEENYVGGVDVVAEDNPQQFGGWKKNKENHQKSLFDPALVFRHELPFVLCFSLY